MLAEQFLRIISGLFVGAWVARYLGPEQVGLFSYVLAITAIFGVIAKLGLNDIIVRELVNFPEKCCIYLGTAFWLKVMGAFIVLVLMAAILPFTSNEGQIKLYIFIITAGLLFQSFEVVEFYFRSQVMAKIVSICKVSQLAIISLVKIYLVLAGAELISFVVLVVLEALCLSICYFFAYKTQKKSAFYKHFDFVIALKLLKESWPMIMSGITIGIYMKIDQVMIKAILSNYDVGIYSVAVRLSEVWIFLTIVITSSLAPSIIRAKQFSNQIYEKRIIILIRVLFYSALAISLTTMILSDRLVNLLYGKEFTDSGNVLRVYVFSILFVFLNNGSLQWFINEKKQKYAFYKLSIGAALNVGLNIYLIPLYGVLGSAYATLISYLMATYLLNIFQRQTLRIFKIQTESIFFLKI